MPVALLNPYCSVAEVLEELKQPASPAQDIQDAVARAINNASRMIDKYKGRDYFQHDFSSTPLKLDEFSNAIVGDHIYLPYSPIIGTLTTVAVGNTILVSNVDFYPSLDGTRLIRLSGGDWADVLRPDTVLSLTGKFGYAQATTADVPTGLPGNIGL